MASCLMFYHPNLEEGYVIVFWSLSCFNTWSWIDNFMCSNNYSYMKPEVCGQGSMYFEYLQLRIQVKLNYIYYILVWILKIWFWDLHLDLWIINKFYKQVGMKVY